MRSEGGSWAKGGEGFGVRGGVGLVAGVGVGLGCEVGVRLWGRVSRLWVRLALEVRVEMELGVCVGVGWG